jgi:hypothetical protein
MTLWQDQPPQTRRQARESERSAALKESDELRPEESSAQANSTERPPSQSSVDGAVDTPFGAARFGAPARPQLPNYEASFDSLIAAEPAQPDKADSPAAAAPQDAPVPRVQPASPSPFAPAPGASFAPPAVGAVSSSQPEPEPEAAAPFELYRAAPPAQRLEPVTRPVAIVPESTDALDGYHAPAGVDPADVSTPERTLTRRELRAILQAQEANNQASGHAEPVGTITPEPRAETASAPVWTPPSVELPPTTATTLPAPTFVNPFAPTAAPVQTPPAEAPRATVLPPAVVIPQTESVSPEPIVVAEQPASDTDEAEKPAFQPPVGHWSTAGELDDKNQPFDQIISRSVGASGGATTTSALILPSIPSAPDATGPLTSTGEILVTGSIDLPRGLGATGQHPDHYDSSDMDRMFEAAEGESNNSDVAPIRASRAVSTHTSTRGVITPPKKRGGRLPVVLLTIAAVLAVGVVALLVAGYILKAF